MRYDLESARQLPDLQCIPDDEREMFFAMDYGPQGDCTCREALEWISCRLPPHDVHYGLWRDRVGDTRGGRRRQASLSGKLLHRKVAKLG